MLFIKNVRRIKNHHHGMPTQNNKTTTMNKETILKPSFFVVGAQKAGTTTFHKLFSKHPEIYLPKKKN